MLKYIFDKDCYRVAFIAITILFAISIFTPFSTILNLFLLFWGAILILKDLFTKRIIFKEKVFIPLIIFMGLYFVTLIINRDLNLFENIKVFALTALQFFVLFAFDKNEDEANVTRGIKNFNNVIIWITFIATGISLLIYIFGINFEINEKVIGVQNGMLTGVYTGANTAGPLAAVSIAVTLINYQLRNSNRLTKFDCINIIIQLIFIYMTNSRATLYCILIFALILAIFYFKGWKNKGIYIVGVGGIYLLSKIVNTILYWMYRGIDMVKQLIVYVFKEAKSYILNHGAMQGGGWSENITSPVTEVVEKEITMGFLNGRAQLWQCGAKILKDNLWFGVGSRNVADVALTYDSLSNLPGILGGGMHNVVIQVLVSNGILGFLALSAFLLPVMFSYFRYLIHSKIRNNTSKVVLLIGSLLVMLLINNMAEVNIFYTASYMATVFWTYLGYGLFIMKKDINGEVND